MLVDEAAIGTERGFGIRGPSKSDGNRKPRCRRRKRLSLRGRPSLEDDIAIFRARIASAFDLLRRAAQAQLIQHYAVKIAGLSLCLRGHELAAAAEQLRSERDAALAAMRVTIQTAERGQVRRSIGMLLRGGPEKQPWLRARGQAREPVQLPALPRAAPKRPMRRRAPNTRYLSLPPPRT